MGVAGNIPLPQPRYRFLTVSTIVWKELSSRESVQGYERSPTSVGTRDVQKLNGCARGARHQSVPRFALCAATLAPVTLHVTGLHLRSGEQQSK